jgi:hypothetical protein
MSSKCISGLIIGLKENYYLNEKIKLNQYYPKGRFFLRVIKNVKL